eukprot:CAMPEP_0194204106 /NCGR_PEP_ID=MMETSP0156-20130528/3725_1 /TAXON_ID=33649 /ORGANISM="Thalassionema nitzschioides, Strain L26-B" /LENGTH=548 /DNA_ID=CAMNT_0038930039 /DNA_START=264 /DNA_END=1910 /DNA_ORIENTATION=-
MSFSEYVQHALFDDDDSSVCSEAGDSPNHIEEGNCKLNDGMDKRGARQNVRWNHGVVKITLPDGWWDEAGIAKDRTGRGAEWQAGTKLGDMVVKGPIKQHVSGIGGVYEFALLDVPAMKLSEFREKADEYRKSQLCSRGADITDGYLDDDACDDLARRFWKRLGPTTPPSMYGADMEGSLFGGDKANGWSLEALDNCLKLLSVDHAAGEVPGVTTPYLYVGMWGSVFCAHTEDMNLLSINYLHAGAPKYWYAISPEHAKRFESLAESKFVHAARECTEFLRHKQNMISPAILKKAGIPFEVQIQRPGDAIITCPGAYHFGVNLGFNIAEATNFAIPEWITKGREAKVCMCQPHSVRIDVDRFAKILDRYQRDTENAQKLGFAEIGYREWIMLEATRRKQNGSKSSAPSTSDHHEKEFWVEVMKPFDGKVGSTTNSSRSKKRRKKNSGNENIHGEEWRLAKPLTTSNKKKKKEQITLETKVLCLLPGKVVSNDYDDDDEDEQCFEGVVKELSDGHCRVHFAGLKKEDDVWIELTSPKLFLDGGKWQAPS